MATRVLLLLLVLLPLLRGTAAVDITPVDGCVLFDTTSWQISVDPSDTPTQDLARLTDGEYGTNCGFEVAAYGGDFDITYDMGQTIYPYVETLAVKTYFWYYTRMPTWSVYTSEDLVQWTLHGSSTYGNGGLNRIDTIGVGPVALRYIQLQYRGGWSKYTSHGRPAIRELAFSNCGAATNTTTTTSTATSSTATTSTATSSTATTSTATTSTATTSTVTTTTVTTSTVTTVTVTTSSTTSTTETSSTSTGTTTTSTTSTTSTTTSITTTTSTTSSSSTSTTTATTSTSSSTTTSTSTSTVTSTTTCTTSSSSSSTSTTSATTSSTSTSTSSLTTTTTSSSTSSSSTTTTTTATTSSTSSSTTSSTTSSTSSTASSSSTSSSSTTVTTSLTTSSTTSSTTTQSTTSSSSTTSLSSTTTATSSTTTSTSSSTVTQTTISISSSTTSWSTTPTTSSTTTSTSSSTATQTTSSTSSTSSTITSSSTRTTTSSTTSSTLSSTLTRTTTSSSSTTSFSSTTSATSPTTSSTASLSSTTTATNSTSTRTTSMSISTSTSTATTVTSPATSSTSSSSVLTTSTSTTTNTAARAAATTATSTTATTTTNTATRAAAATATSTTTTTTTSTTTTSAGTGTGTGVGIGTGTGTGIGSTITGTSVTVTATPTATATASAALLSAVTVVASPAQRAAELIDQVEQVLSTREAADFYLETERDENTTTASWETSAGVAQVFAVENLMQASSSPQDLEVQVHTAEVLVQVTLPAALVAAHTGYTGNTSTPTPGNESLALLVNVFNATGIQGLETTQETADGSVFKLEVRALISIDLVYLFEGGFRHVDVPKTNPIRFSFGINDTAGLECSYWDEAHLEWSTAGVTEAIPADLEYEPFTCETTHLSLFAAIWSGLVSSAECSQISLLTVEAVQQLFEAAGEWATLMGSLFSWGMLLMLLVTFGFASLADMRRSEANTWGSDFFLVAAEVEEPGREESEPELEDELTEDSTHSSEEETSCCRRCLGWLRSAFYTCAGCCSACLGNSAFRDAIDDIASSWCEYFSDARTILEELCSAADSEGGGLMSANCHVLSVRLASHLLIAAVRRQAAAALQVSPDLINFVMEDEELTHFLTEGQEPTTRSTGHIQSSLTTVADLKAKAVRKATAKAARAAARAAAAEGIEDVPGRDPALDCPQPEDAAVDDEDPYPATPKAGLKRRVTIEDPLDLEACAGQAVRNRRTALVTLLSQQQPPKPTLRSGWSAQSQGEEMAVARSPPSMEQLVRGSRSATPGTPSTPGSALGFATSMKSLVSLRRTSSTGRSLMSMMPSMGVLGRHLNWRKTRDKWEAWFVLHHEISEALNQQSSRYVKRIGVGGLRHLRGIIWELFLWQNPWGSTFAFSPFMSCKMRALFFALDILGGLALSILFFEASGTVKGKKGVAKNGSCGRDAEFSGSLGFKLGRLLAVAIGSTFCAGLPVAILTSLHTRDFRSLDQEGSRRWKKQLRAWAIQDRIIWVLGSLYCAFCTFYLVVFLANISETDQRDFTISLVMVLAQVCVIIPLAISIASPALAWFSLSVSELIGGRRREELIRQVNQRLHEEFNIMLPILHI